MPNNIPQVLITPLKPALIEGVAQTLQVLVRVQAPDADPTQAMKERGPYHLSLVIDRSGSMSGVPLVEALRCAQHIVGSLAPTDVASLIAFDDRVDTLVPAGPVGNCKLLQAALSSVHSGGQTNLHGGWDAGALTLKADAGKAALARVILLSDGNANAGRTTNTAEIAAFCAAAAEEGVTTSTYGLGPSFNEELMVEMAKQGGGNSYYAETAADLFGPFAEEFDLISSLYARSVRLSLDAPDGVTITVLNGYYVDLRDGFPVVRMPDIPFGAEAWALLELGIPESLAMEPGKQFLQAAVSATTPGKEPIAFADARLCLPLMPPAAWEALLDDPLVRARQAELAAAKMIDQARAAADLGDWETIQRMIADANTRYADQPWVLEVLATMSELARVRDAGRFSKESLYSSGKMSRRVSAKEELLSSTASEASVPSFLRRKKAQGKAEFDRPPDNDAK